MGQNESMLNDKTIRKRRGSGGGNEVRDQADGRDVCPLLDDRTSVHPAASSERVRTSPSVARSAPRHERQKRQDKAYISTIVQPLEFLPCGVDDPEEDEAVKEALKIIAPSFSVIHQRLLDLAIAKCTTNQNLAFAIPPSGPLVNQHLRSMMAMVEIEFLASLKKELHFPEEKNSSDPLPFDIFLMEPSLYHKNGDLRQQLALCVPTRKKREEEKGMMWYDGRGKLWDLEPRSQRRKVASLSGMARTLEALMHPPTPLMRFAMTREMIVDSNKIRMADDMFCSSNLNDSQQDAVSVVASPDFIEGIFCVQGPPGTGKTHTINAIVEAVGEGIIVTAPSNAAVANVALKVHASRHYDMEKIIVFGQNCDESVRFLNPLHRSEEFRKFMKAYSKLKEDGARNRKRKEFASWLKLPDPSPDASLSDFARLCPHIDLNERPGRTLHNAKLLSASVIFCTLNSSGSNMLRNAIHGAFSTFILDEAGQCTEADFYIGTTFPGIERMIVVGDPLQLPPTVIDQQCSKWGFGISWLARTYNQDKTKVHLLNTQYRMDKAILSFPNRQFYDKRIMSGDNVVGREPYVSHPIQFVDTKGNGREEKNDFSWKNEYEAVVIKSLLKTDEDIVNLRSSSPHTRTIIISPYRAQVSLLTGQLKKIKGVEVTTVDSVQGSEADIVILSTVRAIYPGFVDDSQRLNVALTRAKRVLRVVGDLSFFLSLGRADSTLKKLATFYQHRKLTIAARVQSIAWTSPDWKRQTLWVPTMTSKFHHSMKDMPSHDKNICFNIVLAVSTPNVNLLAPRPSERAKPSWYVSSLRGYSHHLRVVWIPKLRGSDMVIEAHFAGTKYQCNHFIQHHVNVPVGACIVLPDLSGVRNVDDSSKQGNNIKQLITTWPVTNSLMNAVLSCSIDILPQGNLVLDPHQQEISVAKPPLLIESRSGTGKTNVLFQHAVIHTQLEQQQSPGCFVTVSPRLSNELRQRYQEMRAIADDDLPDFFFFCRSDLLRGLLAKCSNVNMDNLCSFREYCKERALASHNRMVIEERLIENEIGGVILGSLAAGTKQRPLTREEYLEEKRSNITNKTERGRATRAAVYNEFEKYQKYKVQRNSSDINDIILMLLKSPSMVQIFDSAYVDEVQDFSYASLLLICKIGGIRDLKWIFAGDTAQMISPGCSFTFNGLKQTLLSLQGGIESKLSKVSHLLVNYRTTRDVLLLGNSILSVAKRNFPNQIAHSLPEIAMKDLGLKVQICDFDDATRLSVKFGHNQALIHSGDDSESSNDSITVVRQWLNGHPFVLTSLESKGLEFDDVVVAFFFSRNIWDEGSVQEESLRMLRELYVAVTRAKRRVVILIRRRDVAMRNFFICSLSSLGCDIETITNPKQLQVEFDCETSPETWNKKGIHLFEEGHFGLAASCFAAANNWGFGNWAKGRHLKSLGDRSEAASAYRRAASHFFEELDYKRTLDMFQELSYFPPWDESDNSMFDKAQSAMPTHFDRYETVRLLLVADRWQNIETRDLKDADTSTLFAGYTDHPKLKNMIIKCSEEDRKAISKVLPSVVAQYFLTAQNYSMAVELYIQSQEVKLAIDSTKRAVKAAKTSDVHVRNSIKAWTQNTRLMRNLNEESYIPLLVHLYDSPIEAAKLAGKKCLSTFGRRLLIFALEQANVEKTGLYEFHPTEFRTEVNKHLESINTCCMDIIKWYIEKHDYDNASEYAQRHWKKISNSELLDIISLDRNFRPGNLMSELKRRNLALDAICRAFLPQLSFEEAITAAELELGRVHRNDSGKLKELVIANVRYFEDNGVFSQIHESALSHFLDLCRDPYFAITTLKTSCAKFGKERILKAVSYGGPYVDDVWVFLSNFSPKYFKTTRKWALLKAFHDVGNYESTNWYAKLNKENWTTKELNDLAQIMELPFSIGMELLRRGMAEQGLSYALDSGDDDTAMQASMEMLKSRRAAEENIIKVISAWGERRPDFLHSPRALLKFTGNPKYESCDEMTALLITFGPSVTAFLNNYFYQGDCDGNMLNLMTHHHLQLCKHVKSPELRKSPNVPKNGDKRQGTGLSTEKNALHSASTSDHNMIDTPGLLVSGAAVHIDSKTQPGKRNKRKNRKNKKKR